MTVLVKCLIIQTHTSTIFPFLFLTVLYLFKIMIVSYEHNKYKYHKKFIFLSFGDTVNCDSDINNSS